MRFSRDSEWFAPVVMSFGVLVFFGLVIGAIFLVRPPMQNVGRHQQPIYAFDSSPTSIQVGQVRLGVAKNHVREVQQDKVILHALLPKFEGYQHNNWWLFEGKSVNARMIIIQIEKMKAMISEQTRFQFLSGSQLEKETQSTAPLGLTRYLYKKNSKRHDQDVFAGFDNNNRQLVYFCFRPTALSFAPHCTRTLALTLDTALTYKFKRYHLNNWREIENNIQKFIQEIHRLSYLDTKDSLFQ